MSNYRAVNHPRTALFVLYFPLPFYFSHPLLFRLDPFFCDCVDKLEGGSCSALLAFAMAVGLSIYVDLMKCCQP